MRWKNTQPEEAIRALEAARRTLADMAARHGKLISRMAEIQERGAIVDFGLLSLFESDPAKYAAVSPTLTDEAYEICDKLSLVKRLGWNAEIVYAETSFARADQQAEDGLRLDVELLFKAARGWEERLRSHPDDTSAKSGLVVVRRRLAEELTDRGRMAEAPEWSRRSLETIRGNPELLYTLAVTYAKNARLCGTYPTRLNADQLRERRRRFVAGAVAMLRQAVADGFHDAARVRGNPLFDPLRSDPGFGAIVADLEFPSDPFGPVDALVGNARY